MRSRLPIDRALMGQVRALLARRDERPLPAGHARPEMKVVAQDGGGAEMFIYDEISYWGICATDIAAALATVQGDLTVRINSPGGDVFDGVAIYNLFADYPGQVHMIVDGLAASAASFIAQAGDTVTMNRAAQMMIHDGSGLCQGNEADMKAFAALLGMVSGTIAGIYAARAGGTPEEWRAAMLADNGIGTWYTAESAVEAGLADGLVPLAERPAQEPAAAQALDRMAALFPYGTNDAEGRWQLAALVPQIAVTAVAPHQTSAQEGTWDASANEGRLPSPMPVATAKRMYGWYDDGQVEDGHIVKAGCKLPHHFVNEDGTPGAASINGVRNALARLPQTKGLTDDERNTIERHLHGHLPSDEEARSPIEPEAAVEVHVPVEAPADLEPAALTAAPTAAESQPPEPEPDDWSQLVAPLTTAEPSAEDLLASLREA